MRPAGWQHTHNGRSNKCTGRQSQSWSLSWRPWGWVSDRRRAAAMGLGIGSAAADGSGSCTLTGGTVQLKVREYPGEGDVLYLRINSPVELTSGNPSPTHAYLFNSDGLQVNNTYYFYPAPIDGDGY